MSLLDKIGKGWQFEASIHVQDHNSSPNIILKLQVVINF